MNSSILFGNGVIHLGNANSGQCQEPVKARLVFRISNAIAKSGLKFTDHNGRNDDLAPLDPLNGLAVHAKCAPLYLATSLREAGCARRICRSHGRAPTRNGASARALSTRTSPQSEVSARLSLFSPVFPLSARCRDSSRGGVSRQSPAPPSSSDTVYATASRRFPSRRSSRRDPSLRGHYPVPRYYGPVRLLPSVSRRQVSQVPVLNFRNAPCPYTPTRRAHRVMVSMRPYWLRLL